jgi:hypothetical protein
MSRRTVLTVICDGCGLMASFEHLSMSFGHSVYTHEVPATRGWTRQKMEGGGQFSFLDYCADCTKERKDQ